MSESLTRNFSIESIRSTSEDNSLEATLSTEYAVDRGSYREILLHEKSALDLSRVPLPLIVNHNRSELNIGVVDNVRIVGRKLKGQLRFGISKRAQEIKAEAEAGIVTNLSIGYEISDYIEEGENLFATKWMPYEVSAVAVGADPNAGIGRSFNFNEDLKMSEETNQNQPGKPSRAQRAQMRLGAEQERDRIANINAAFSNLREKLSSGGIRLLTAYKDECIENGYDFEDFRVRGMDIWGKHPKPEEYSYSYSVPGAYAGERGYGGFNDFSRFSVCKAIQDRIEPGSVDAGFEREVNQELHQLRGKRDQNIMVPFSRNMTVGTDTSGGYLVETEMRPDRFIDPLSPKSIIMDLNVTQMNDLVGDVTLPGASSDPAADNYNLDDTDTIAETDPTLKQVLLTPTSIAALTTLGHKLVKQSSNDAEMMVRQMLGRSVGSRFDNQSIQGDGVGSNMTGIVNVTGIGSVTYTNGGSPTWANVVNLEAELAVDDVDMNNIAYLVNPVDAAKLKTTEVATNTGVFILSGGQMNGYRVLTSTHVPAGTIIIGAWSDFIVGTWGILSLEIDPYTGFRKGSVDVRAILDCCAAVRHPQAFATLTEAP
jgi:HK97 family phage major capsid protein